MPRDKRQKLKILYIKDFFEEMTDDDHIATMQDILAYLEQNGIPAERKGIYDDLDALADYGMNVRDEEKLKNKGYKWIDRNFELKEIKLIIDSVASSKFLSESKSSELIKKLMKLCSVHQRKELRRQVCVLGRARTMNDSTLNAIDHIHAAIAENKIIRFKYFHYNLKKEREYTHQGKKQKSPYYEVSPWALLYDNNNYYLLAYIDDDFKTFRVDRMTSVSKGEQDRQGSEAFTKLDMATYTKSTFGMYRGKEEWVEMVFQNQMVDTVIDKFGKDIRLTKEDDQHFRITVPVSISPQFFAWVFGLGNYVTIKGPDNVVKQMKDMLAKVSGRYK